MSVTSQSEYRRIAYLLRAAITDGTYARGELLPTEVDLARKLGVDRSTVNRALKVLRAEGWVRVHRGKGHFVTELPPLRRNPSARYSRAARERDGARGAFDAQIRALGREPRSELTIERLELADTGAPAAVAAVLSGALVVRRRRMFADDIPVQLADSYIPLAIAAGTALEEEDSGVGGIVSRFADLGHTQTHGREQLSVRPPTETECALLDMTPDQRVYDIVHVAYATDDTGVEYPVEVCLHVQPTHLWEHVSDFAIDPRPHD